MYGIMHCISMVILSQLSLFTEFVCLTSMGVHWVISKTKTVKVMATLNNLMRFIELSELEF